MDEQEYKLEDYIKIFVDYFKALNSNQSKLIRCLGFRAFAEQWLKDRN